MQESLEQLVARINASAYLPGEGIGIMAKPVKLAKGKDFVFKSAPKGGGESKYTWDEWFSGSLLLLERSEGTENDKGTIEIPTTKRDFEVGVNAMVPKLHTAARRRYKVVQVSRLDADGTKLKNAIIIRARDMTPDERQEEDLLRAEEREEAKARRKAGLPSKSDKGLASATAAAANAPTTAHAGAPPVGLVA